MISGSSMPGCSGSSMPGIFRIIDARLFSGSSMPGIFRIIDARLFRIVDAWLFPDHRCQAFSGSSLPGFSLDHRCPAVPDHRCPAFLLIIDARLFRIIDALLFRIIDALLFRIIDARLFSGSSMPGCSGSLMPGCFRIIDAWLFPDFVLQNLRTLKIYDILSPLFVKVADTTNTKTKKEKTKMKIDGLKFLQDKGWNAASTFTSDSGRVMPIPANQKIVATDEVGDVVNVTIQTEKPLTFKAGQPIGAIILTGSVSKTAFGWSLKGTL